MTNEQCIISYYVNNAVRTKFDKSCLDEIGILDTVDYRLYIEKTMGLFNICGQYNENV